MRRLAHTVESISPPMDLKRAPRARRRRSGFAPAAHGMTARHSKPLRRTGRCSGAGVDGIEIRALAWDKVISLARSEGTRCQSAMEGVVDEAAKIQLDYLQKTLHDQQRRFEDVEQAIIDLAKRLEAIEQSLASRS